uniref:invasin domain 3-containing protein n=1 Tax=Thaumasiovibrio sp. DFM-14 TaxID=3384792 RepID=UPI00399F18DF
VGSAQAASFSATLDLSQSTFGLTSSSAAADGSAEITANLQLNDYAGSAFSGDVSKVNIALASGTATAGTLSDNGNGSYSVSFTSTTAGNVSISATYDGTPVGSAQAASFTVDVSGSESTLAASPAAGLNIDNDTYRLAVGESLTFTLLLKKSDGANYGSSLGNLTISGGSGATVSQNDNNDGSYSITISRVSAGSNTLSVQVGGITIATQPTIVFTQADASQTVFTGGAALTMTVAGSASKTITVRDGDMNNVGHGGHTITAGIAPADSWAVAMNAVSDNEDGTYQLQFLCDNGLASTRVMSFTIDVDGETGPQFTLTCND